MDDLAPQHRRAALTLNAAILNHRQVSLRPEELADMGIGQARRIVADNVERWAQRGLPRMGWGATLMSPSRQEAHGITEPIVGALMGSMYVESGQRITLSRLHTPVVGASLAFKMNMDLPEQGCSTVDIRRCTSSIHAALHVADSRLVDASDGIALQADNGGLGLTVLSPRGKALTKVDLTNVVASLQHKGKEVGTGAGRSLMGDPIEAAAWVVRTVGSMGFRVQAGDLVLLGACTPVFPLREGEWTVSLPMVGTSTVHVLKD